MEVLSMVGLAKALNLGLKTVIFKIIMQELVLLFFWSMENIGIMAVFLLTIMQHFKAELCILPNFLQFSLKIRLF